MDLRLRALAKLPYREPRKLLVRLRALEIRLAMSQTPPTIRHLRTNRLKPFRELREAAIFCYLMSERIGTVVRLAQGESQDYDFVACWHHGDEARFAPVQIKELVPSGLNPEATFHQLLVGLKKYTSSPELVVAVHINRAMHFDPSALEIHKLPIAELWAFGATTSDQNEWSLWGNLLRTKERTCHAFPVQ